MRCDRRVKIERRATKTKLQGYSEINGAYAAGRAKL